MFRRSFIGSWFGAVAGLFAVRETPAASAPHFDVTSLDDTAVRSALGKPVVFLEYPHALSEAGRQCIRDEWARATDGSHDLIILDSGATLANQQAWRPQTLDIECGNISIHSPNPIGKGTKLLIDGVEPKHVRRIVVEITPHDPIKVHVEHNPR